MAERQPIGFLASVDPLLMQPQYPLFDKGVRIGRDAEYCGIILSRDFVSRQHCLIAPNNGGVVIEDLETTNGTYVNGEKIHKVALAEGDRIGLGRAAPHQLVYMQSPKAAQRLYLLPPQKTYRIGRSPDSDLPLAADPTVSWEHARLRVLGQKLVLQDLGSESGTFINGSALTHATVSAGDRITIGSWEFQFEQSADGLRVRADQRRNRAELQAKSLGRVHRQKVILRDISLVFKPGEYVGVLGPSGAGKSTLLNALSGFQPANRGDVLLNGLSLYKAYDMFRNTIGYVPQDDIIHAELTVERSLTYTAQLRLPDDAGSDHISEQVTTIIEMLGLSHVRHSRVLNLSGGQRKRVSIGCELLTRPSLLFLDEPTSGLDPATEEKLMRHFRQMAEHGQTIVLTTHVLYNLDLLNLVVLLARGRLVYFGPTSELCEYFSAPEKMVSRPIEVFDLLEPEYAGSSILEERAEYYEQRYKESPLYKQYVLERQMAAEEPGLLPGGQAPSKTDSRHSRRRGGSSARLIKLGHLATLIRRTFDQKTSFPSRLTVPLLAPIVLALLTSTISVGDQGELDRGRSAFEESSRSFLALLDEPGMPLSAEEFMRLRFEGFAGLAIPLSLPLTMAMTAVFLGTLSACLEISSERSIYMRERAINLRIPTYVLSKLPALFLLNAVQCFLYVSVTMLIIRPPGVDIALLALICIALAWSSSVLGLFISSLDPSPGQTSVILAVVAMLPQMMLSGAMAPAFYGGLSLPVKAIANVLPARWGMEQMLTVFYQRPEWAEGFISGQHPSGMGFDYGAHLFFRNNIALLALSCLYFLFTCISLKRLDRL